MKLNKQFIVIGGVIVFVIIGIAASKPPRQQFKNLKVLPKNISEQTMDSVMNEFEKALGVECDFCHVKPADTTAQWDMADDSKPEKEIARKMITMSNKINKDFFNATTKYGDENAVLEIHCVTCHHGEPHPEMEDQEEEKKQ
jgi:nitrate/TMAO reductase-like tetraheme cytochrome c subunit